MHARIPNLMHISRGISTSGAFIKTVIEPPPGTEMFFSTLKYTCKHFRLCECLFCVGYYPKSHLTVIYYYFLFHTSVYTCNMMKMVVKHFQFEDASVEVEFANEKQQLSFMCVK